MDKCECGGTITTVSTFGVVEMRCSKCSDPKLADPKKTADREYLSPTNFRADFPMTEIPDENIPAKPVPDEDIPAKPVSSKTKTDRKHPSKK